METFSIGDSEQLENSEEFLSKNSPTQKNFSVKMFSRNQLYYSLHALNSLGADLLSIRYLGHSQNKEKCFSQKVFCQEKKYIKSLSLYHRLFLVVCIFLILLTSTLFGLDS